MHYYSEENYTEFSFQKDKTTTVKQIKD